jgi:hypothetical protein
MALFPKPVPKLRQERSNRRHSFRVRDARLLKADRHMPVEWQSNPAGM